MMEKISQGVAEGYGGAEIFYPIRNVRGFETISPGAAHRTDVSTIEQCDCVIAFWDPRDAGLAFSIGTAYGLRRDIVLVAEKLDQTLKNLRKVTLATIPLRRATIIGELIYLLKIISPHYIRKTPAEDWLLPVAEAIQSRWIFDSEKENDT